MLSDGTFLTWCLLLSGCVNFAIWSESRGWLRWLNLASAFVAVALAGWLVGR